MFGLTPAKAVSIEDLHEMLDWDGCYGLDETPFSSVIDKDEGMLGLFEATLAKGKVITGHVRGADERQVQAFVGMGGSVDHELVSVDDVLARARAGNEGADALWLGGSRPAQSNRRLHEGRYQPAPIGALYGRALAGGDLRGRRRHRGAQNDRGRN